MFSNFSQTVADLYEIAEHESADACLQQILLCINKLIPHDGAIFGTGGFETGRSGSRDFFIDSAYCFNLDPQIVVDYAKILKADLSTQAFYHGLRRPLACCCAELDQESALLTLQTFTKKYGLRHMLLFGTPLIDDVPTRWIILYRSDTPCFTKLSACYLRALWPHIERAMVLNRKSLLQHANPGITTRGFAIITAQYRIEASESAFDDLLRVEWPAWECRILPRSTWGRLANGVDYAGSQIRLSIINHGSSRLCQVVRLSSTQTLTRAERIIAAAYGAGHTNKEIAREMNVSISTIRTHVAHVFQKLDVHRRSDLLPFLER